MTTLHDTHKTLRVAIVGSGPAGFYAADALLHSGRDVCVSIFDRLPTPYGLVRAGVAPDHPKIKSVTKVFDRIATMPGCSFWGNVAVGRDVSLDELRQFFDVILLAYGAEKDRSLGIPNEDLPQSHAATEFVGWYNGHPDYRDSKFDLSCESVVIVGQGNVALDVARILAKPIDALAHTDIAAHALEALAESRVREIHIVGRRGPVQARFTAAEIKEFLAIPNCRVVVDPAVFNLDEISCAELALPESTHARANLEVLRNMAASSSNTAQKTVFFHFFKSPVALDGQKRLMAVRFEHTELAGEPLRTRARGTGQLVAIPCGMLLKSVGYRGVPLSGVPFDEVRGVIPTSQGRVITDGATTGLYASGWIKRGPQGVIGTNKPDAAETVQCILEDLPHIVPCQERDDAALRELLQQRGIHVVSFDDWRRIDAAEIERGKPLGKSREKFTRVEEMLAVL